MAGDPVFVTANEGMNSSQYQCEICGTGLQYAGRGRKPRFCDEHKGGGGKASTKKGKGLAASEEQWRQFLCIGLLYGTYGIGRFAAGGKGLMLAAPNGDEDEFTALAEALAMNVDEANPIANLVAKRAQPSKLNKKAGWVVVNALELEDVGSALLSYSKRIAPFLAQRVNKKPSAEAQNMRRTVRIVRNEPTGPDQPSETTTSQPVGANAAAVAAYREQQRKANPAIRANDTGT